MGDKFSKEIQKNISQGMQKNAELMVSKQKETMV